MSVIIIGGDYLGGIEKNLYSIGVTDIVHISGRKTVDRKKFNVPKSADLILILTDYVNHTTAQTVKEAAKSRSIPLVYAKRSWRAIEEKLSTFTMLSN